MSSDLQLTRAQFEALTEAFAHTKAENDDLLLENTGKVFVGTEVFDEAQIDGRCIILGRKGSGKTAILTGHIFKYQDKYLSINRFEADDIPFEVLYNFFMSDFAKLADTIRGTFKRSDISDFLNPVKIANFSWKNAIRFTALQQAINSILSNKEKLDLSEDEIEVLRKGSKRIEEILPADTKSNLTGTSANAHGTLWGALVYFYLTIQETIEQLLSVDSKSFARLIASIIAGLTKKLHDSFTVDSQLDESLKIVSKYLTLHQKFVFVGLDKFDDYFDFYYGNLRHPSLARDRSEFLNSLVEGLILAGRDLKNDKDFRWLHLLITIPTDKFLEFKFRERAEIEHARVIPLQWTPTELYHFVNKRIAIALDLPKSDWEDAWYKIFPRSVTNNGNKAVKEDSFLYLLRHTHWKPRDIQYLLGRVFDQMNSEKPNKIPYVATPEMFNRAALHGTQDLIRREFIPEFESEYPGIRIVLKKLENRHTNTMMKYTEFCDAIGGVELRSGVSTPDKIAERLFQMGVIGVRNPIPPNASDLKHGIVQDREKVEYQFCFNSDDLNPFSEDSNVVFHPMFFDALRIVHSEGFVIGELRWETTSSSNSSRSVFGD